MCYMGKNPEMAPLQPGHLHALQTFLTQEQGEHEQELVKFSQTVFQGWTEFLNPHLPIMAIFVAMYDSWLKQDFGILSDYRLIRLPLSVIGSDKIRYRTPIISFLHETVLSARMSDLAVEKFAHLAAKHGLCILYMCSCGIVMGSCQDVARFKNSDLHQNMDRLRSAIDAEGHPVKEVSWADLSEPNMDLHPGGSELRMFQRVEELLLASLSAKTVCLEDWIDNQLQTMIARVHTLELAY